MVDGCSLDFWLYVFCWGVKIIQEFQFFQQLFECKLRVDGTTDIWSLNGFSQWSCRSHLKGINSWSDQTVMADGLSETDVRFPRCPCEGDKLSQISQLALLKRLSAERRPAQAAMFPKCFPLETMSLNCSSLSTQQEHHLNEAHL